MDCNLIKEWSRLYLLSEGLDSITRPADDNLRKKESQSKEADDFEAEHEFRNSKEYEEFMKKREKTISEDDGDDEEVEEIDIMEEIKISKDNLIENLEKALENREERSEDEIKEILTLLNVLDPEKLSDEDKVLLNPPSDEEETTEVDSTEEVENEEEN